CSTSGRGGMVLTCMNGPVFEQTGVLLHLPAVSCSMLPGDGEHLLVLHTPISSLVRIKSCTTDRISIELKPTRKPSFFILIGWISPVSGATSYQKGVGHC
uniref:Uncharacterized protein n=1 Tax=Gadus morhua TaxID=8049 RepID=A0A8C5BVF5_GADMO